MLLHKEFTVNQEETVNLPYMKNTFIKWMYWKKDKAKRIFLF